MTRFDSSQDLEQTPGIRTRGQSIKTIDEAGSSVDQVTAADVSEMATTWTFEITGAALSAGVVKT